MTKTIITVVGKDTVGIIARICTYLAEKNINILDITQTTMQGYFNMMMIVDTTDVAIPHDSLCREIAELGKEIGVEVRAQKEEIFSMMHRI